MNAISATVLDNRREKEQKKNWVKRRDTFSNATSRFINCIAIFTPRFLRDSRRPTKLNKRRTRDKLYVAYSRFLVATDRESISIS